MNLKVTILTCDISEFGRGNFKRSQTLHKFLNNRNISIELFVLSSVNDIQELNFGSGFEYKESSDHSKWAVTADGSVFCSADINRMTTQYARGGGAMCMKNAQFATQMKNAITAHDQC